MKSQFASELTMRIWIDFKSHFKSQTTEASYQSDLDEIMEYTGKDFLKLSCADVDNYYNYMKERIDEGQLKGSTAAKKFRELHSFAQYLCENRENYHIQSEDLYEPYLKLLEKQEKLAKSVPVGDIDKLFEAAKMIGWHIVSLHFYIVWGLVLQKLLNCHPMIFTGMRMECM